MTSIQDQPINGSAQHVNPHYGWHSAASERIDTFKYKDVSEYTLDEWLKYIRIVPSENDYCLDQFGFMDVRLLCYYTRMCVEASREFVDALKDDPTTCAHLIHLYFQQKYTSVPS